MNETKTPDGRWKLLDEFKDGSEVSTVEMPHLGFDLGYGFETMVFDADGHGGDCERYATKEEALAGHKAMVARFLATRGEKDGT